MSITTIQLEDNDIDVTITRPDGSPLNVNGPLSGAFGVDSDGNPYFDTDGPDPGETATLGWDGSTAHLFLDSRYASDEHLMMLTGPGGHQAARAAARSRTAPRSEPVAMPAGVELDHHQAARATARSR